MSQIKNEISVKRIIEPNVIPKIKRRRNKEILTNISGTYFNYKRGKVLKRNKEVTRLTVQ